MTTLTQDQITMLKALLDSVSALKGSVGIAPSAPAKTSTKKVKDPNAPKRKPHAVIEEQKAVYAEMKAAYRTEHGISDETTDEAIRKMAKEGKLPSYPSYPDALKEYSRRRAEKDPEHARKAKAYRDRLDAKQAQKKEQKVSDKSSDATSVVTDAPAPAPEPVVAPTQDKPKKKISLGKNVKKDAPPPPPAYEIIVANETDDPEEYNKLLKIDGKTYAMNAKNHVATTDAEWVGIWDPVAHKITECDPPEDDNEDDDGEDE